MKYYGFKFPKSKNAPQDTNDMVGIWIIGIGFLVFFFLFVEGEEFRKVNQLEFIFYAFSIIIMGVLDFFSVQHKSLKTVLETIAYVFGGFGVFIGLGLLIGQQIIVPSVTCFIILNAGVIYLLTKEKTPLK